MVLFYLLWVEFGFFHLGFCDLRVFDFASRVVFSSLMLFDFVLEFFFFFFFHHHSCLLFPCLLFDLFLGVEDCK